jgi:hypothetical protein
MQRAMSKAVGGTLEITPASSSLNRPFDGIKSPSETHYEIPFAKDLPCYVMSLRTGVSAIKNADKKEYVGSGTRVSH